MSEGKFRPRTSRSLESVTPAGAMFSDAQGQRPLVEQQSTSRLTGLVLTPQIT